MVTDLGWIIRVPGDWGLEVGILAEVHRNCENQRVCQVDLVDSYEHKHQDLSAANPERGLLKMSVDIAKTMFRTLASDGVVLSDEALKTLRAVPRTFRLPGKRSRSMNTSRQSMGSCLIAMPNEPLWRPF